MVAEEIKKNQEHANMEHLKSKGTDLQNTKTFKDSKHKEHKPKPKPNPQALANPEHHMKNQTLHTNIKPSVDDHFRKPNRKKKSSNMDRKELVSG